MIVSAPRASSSEKSHPFYAGVAAQIYGMHQGFLEEIPSAAHVVPPPSAQYLRATDPNPPSPRVVFRLEITNEDIDEGFVASRTHNAVQAYMDAEDTRDISKIEEGVSKALEWYTRSKRPRHG